MTMTHTRPDNHPNGLRRLALAALLAVLISGVLLAGCGSSSKPSYCDPITKAEDAIKSLPTAQDVKKNGVGTLSSALSTLQQDATNAVNQAKSDFSSQTTALKNSVDTLSRTVKQLVSSPSVSALAQLPAQLSAVATNGKNLQSAVASKCG